MQQMLTKKDLERIARCMKQLHRIPSDEAFRIEDVKSEDGKDAVISLGTFKFAITEGGPDNLIISPKLLTAKLESHGVWTVTWLNGETATTNVLNYNHS